MVQLVKIGFSILVLIAAHWSPVRTQDTLCTEGFDGLLYDYIGYVSNLSGVQIIYANNKLANRTFSSGPQCNTLDNILRQCLDTNKMQVNLESGRALIAPKPIITRLFEGIIIDSITGVPIEFAGVVILSQQKGTLANKEGRFSLTIPAHQLPDTLVISCLGYKNAHIPITQNADSLNVLLTPAVFEITAVTVAYADAGSIIDKAIQNIGGNYIDTVEVLNSFFRELSSKDGVYFAANEVVAKVIKRPVSSSLNDNGCIIGGRRSCETQKLSYLEYTLRGGLFNHLKIDIVKHPPSFLRKEFSNLYLLHFGGITQMNNRAVYIIGFRQSESVRFPGFEGVVYVDTINYAIVGSDFWYSDNSIRETAQIFVQKKSKGLKVVPLRATYSVRYAPYGKRWRLHTLRGEVAFSIRDRRGENKIDGVFESVSEMVVTSTDSVYSHHSFISQLRPTDILSQQVDLFSPESLSEYPVILPERKLEEALQFMQTIRIDSQYTK